MLYKGFQLLCYMLQAMHFHSHVDKNMQGLPCPVQPEGGWTDKDSQEGANQLGSKHRPRRRQCLQVGIERVSKSFSGLLSPYCTVLFIENF